MMTASASSHLARRVQRSEVASRSSEPQGRPAVSIARAAGTAVLTLEGVIHASGTDWLRHLLGDLIDGRGNQSIVVDLRQVEEVDRLVLALLVSVSDRVGRRGGLLVLRDPSAAVVEGLDRAGLGGAFQVRLTHEDRVAASVHELSQDLLVEFVRR